jgi:hypothetical protein
LARHDEGSAARPVVADAQEAADRNDHNDERKRYDKVNLSGIVVTPVADFPAHCLGPRIKPLHQCLYGASVPGNTAMRLSLEGGAAESPCA